jgi:hypothetical protein
MRWWSDPPPRQQFSFYKGFPGFASARDGFFSAVPPILSDISSSADEVRRSEYLTTPRQDTLVCKAGSGALSLSALQTQSD